MDALSLWNVPDRQIQQLNVFSRSQVVFSLLLCLFLSWLHPQSGNEIPDVTSRFIASRKRTSLFLKSLNCLCSLVRIGLPLDETKPIPGVGSGVGTGVEKEDALSGRTKRERAGHHVCPVQVDGAPSPVRHTGGLKGRSWVWCRHIEFQGLENIEWPAGSWTYGLGASEKGVAERRDV